jgi:hypothetical protein
MLEGAIPHSENNYEGGTELVATTPIVSPLMGLRKNEQCSPTKSCGGAGERGNACHVTFHSLKKNPTCLLFRSVSQYPHPGLVEPKMDILPLKIGFRFSHGAFGARSLQYPGFGNIPKRLVAWAPPGPNLKRSLAWMCLHGFAYGCGYIWWDTGTFGVFQKSQIIGIHRLKVGEFGAFWPYQVNSLAIFGFNL